MGKNSHFCKQFSYRESLWWLLWCLIVSLGVWANHHYHDIDGALRATAGVFWLMMLGIVGIQTQFGRTFLSFVRQAYRELNKIVWPTRRETLNITGVLVIIVVVVMVLLWCMDVLFESLMSWVIRYYS